MYNITPYDWLIGFGVMFGFAFSLSVLSEFSIEKFFGYLTFLNAYMIWIEFLPLWTLIINILVLVFMVMTKFKSGVN